MEPKVNIALEAARAGGKELLRFSDEVDTMDVIEKGPTDYVTELDKRAEDIIISSLKKTYPRHSYLSEEIGEIKGKGEDADSVWIIDPLDGTTNFAQKFYLFAVSIAIEINNNIEGGVIYIPYFDEMYYAIKGKGAYLNENPIRVSQKENLINSVIATGFPYSKNNNSDNNLEEHNKMIIKCRDIRRAGSAAIDLVYTASGIWDGYWEKELKPWDIAAGALIVEEAGGIVKGLNGEKFDYISGNIIAGNKKMVNLMIDVIN